jgi:hypothetical protein
MNTNVDRKHDILSAQIQNQQKPPIRKISTNIESKTNVGNNNKDDFLIGTDSKQTKTTNEEHIDQH